MVSSEAQLQLRLKFQLGNELTEGNKDWLDSCVGSIEHQSQRQNDGHFNKKNSVDMVAPGVSHVNELLV